MPFVKISSEDIINKAIEKDTKLKEELNMFNQYFDLIKESIDIRHSLNISQEKLSDYVGLHPITIVRLEKMHTMPTLYTFMAYINGLGYKIKLIKKDE